VHFENLCSDRTLALKLSIQRAYRNLCKLSFDLENLPFYFSPPFTRRSLGEVGLRFPRKTQAVFDLIVETLLIIISLNSRLPFSSIALKRNLEKGGWINIM